MSSIRKAFYHLQMAKEYFADESRERPNTVGADAGRKYIKKLEWICKDFYANPHISGDTMQGFRNELNGDILFPMAMAEKVLALPEDTKEVLEEMIDLLLKGETLTIEHQPQ